MQEATHMPFAVCKRHMCVTSNVLAHYPLCLFCQESVEGAESETVLFFSSRAGPQILQLKELCSLQTRFLHTQQYWGTQA